MKGKKTGGRTKGTPNKPKPGRAIIAAHSLEYFTPEAESKDGLSPFERDLLQLTPDERVAAEIRLLKYHIPELRSIDLDATVSARITIEDRLRQLSDEVVG